jgi:type I restriction enzyme M protein
MLDIDVYKMLRSVIQHDTRADFILSGTMEMERLMRDYQAAMFGSSISKKIDFLDEEDARKLIVRPVQTHVTYDQKAVDMIVELTASHPYFVQLICWTLMRYLIDRGKAKVSAHDVERILPLALERGVHFDEIWATDTTELELYIMAVVGELSRRRGSWCTVSEIEKRLKQERQMPTNPDEFDEAILNLTNRRIFRRSEDGSAVRFQVDVFGQWVHTNKPLEVVRRDIRAEAAARRRRIERQAKAGDRSFEIRRSRGRTVEGE